MGIYFVSEEHKEKFKKMVNRWKAHNDREYKTACYILALPMIYYKVKHLITDFEYPVDWIWRYLEWSESYNEDWKYYRDPKDEDAEHPDEIKWHNEKPFDLSSSMVKLGRFSLNLWNSSNESNLMDCLGSLDSENFNVLMCAIYIRMGRV